MKISDISGTSSTVNQFTYNYPRQTPAAQYGWECPRCGCINAPWANQCSCSRNTYTITATDIGIKNENLTPYSIQVNSVDNKPKPQSSINANNITYSTKDNPWNAFITPTVGEINTQYCLNQKAVDNIRDNPPRGGSSQQDN